MGPMGAKLHCGLKFHFSRSLLEKKMGCGKLHNAHRDGPSGGLGRARAPDPQKCPQGLPWWSSGGDRGSIPAPGRFHNWQSN